MKHVFFNKTTGDGGIYSCLSDISRASKLKIFKLTAFRKIGFYEDETILIIFDLKTVPNKTKIRTYKPFKRKSST